MLTYKSMLLVPRNNGVDVIDQETGKWYQAHSLRAAKWNVSVWQRLCREFKSGAELKAA